MLPGWLLMAPPRPRSTSFRLGVRIRLGVVLEEVFLVVQGVKDSAVFRRAAGVVAAVGVCCCGSCILASSFPRLLGVPRMTTPAGGEE